MTRENDPRDLQILSQDASEIFPSSRRVLILPGSIESSLKMSQIPTDSSSLMTSFFLWSEIESENRTSIGTSFPSSRI